MLRFFVDNNVGELGISLKFFYGYSKANMYSDPVYGSVETPVVFYESLWKDYIWSLNENPVYQNGFEQLRQEGFGVNASEFHDIWNDFK